MSRAGVVLSKLECALGALFFDDLRKFCELLAHPSEFIYAIILGIVQLSSEGFHFKFLEDGAAGGEFAVDGVASGVIVALKLVAGGRP